MINLISYVQFISSIITRKYGSREYIPTKEEFQAFMRCLEDGIIDTLEHPFVITTINDIINKHPNFSAEEAAKLVLDSKGHIRDMLIRNTMKYVANNNIVRKYTIFVSERDSDYEKFVELYK